MHTNPTEVSPAQARKVIRDIEAAIKNIALFGETESVKQGRAPAVAYEVQKCVNILQEKLSSLVGGNWHHAMAPSEGWGERRYTRLWRPEPMDTATYKALKDLLREAKDENIRIGALYRTERMR